MFRFMTFGWFKMRFSHLIVFLIVTSAPLVTSVSVLTTNKIARATTELIPRINETWKLVSKSSNSADKYLSQYEVTVFTKIDHINLLLNELNQKSNGTYALSIIDEILTNLPQGFRFFERIRNYKILLNGVNEEMGKLVRDIIIEGYKNASMIDFCNNVTSHIPNSVLNLIKEFYQSVVVSPNFLTFFSLQLQNVNGDLLCNTQQSPQQMFYTLLEEFLFINAKSYTTIQFAYMTKQMYEPGNFMKEAEKATKDFKQRTNKMITTIKGHITETSRELLRCDPNKHVAGETYVQITNLIRGQIVNEVNLDPKGDCKQSCDSFKYTKTQDCKNDDPWQKTQTHCPKIINCQLIDSDMTVCKANRASNRNYEFVIHANGRVFGNYTRCTNQITHLSSYSSSLFKCSYCFCLCDVGEKFYSDRFINLRASVANIDSNRVVTGLRFVKRNRIIHLQIQEGKLSPGGKIDLNTVRWVPVDDYKITGKYSVAKEQDYHILSWEERAIGLSNVTVEEGYLVTGVRFRKVGTLLDLQVLTTPFNFTTGQLMDKQNRSFYINNSNDTSKYKLRKALELNKPDIPIRSRWLSIPDISVDKYVQFTNSDFDKDAAQTTVPFIDAQPVASLVPVPLSGVGIYYKGQKGYGGFIAPKIFTYDFSQHLDEVFEK